MALLLLVAFAPLAVRLPLAYWHGFQGEEGEIFFAYAWHHDWRQALFLTLGGYVNLLATGTPLLAVALVRHGVISLEHAPLVTLTVAVVVEMMPALVIATARARWLEPWQARVAAILFIAIPPMTGEVVLNTMHGQFHLALAAAAILATDTERSRPGRLACLALLVLAPLCGAAVIVLLPLFALRAAVDRDRARGWQALALLAGSAAQFLLFYHGSAIRLHPGPVLLLAIVGVRLVAFVATTKVGAAALSTASIHAAAFDHQPFLAAAVAIAGGGAMAFLGWRQRRDAGPWLLGACGLFAVVGYWAAIGNPVAMLDLTIGRRYDFLPLVLGGWLLVAAGRAADRVGQVARLLAILTLTQGIGSWTLTAFPEASNGIGWRNEVALWRADPQHVIKAWPDYGGGIDLRPRDDSRDACQGPAGAQPPYCPDRWDAFHAKGLLVLQRQLQAIRNADAAAASPAPAR